MKWGTSPKTKIETGVGEEEGFRQMTRSRSHESDLQRRIHQNARGLSPQLPVNLPVGVGRSRSQQINLSSVPGGFRRRPVRGSTTILRNYFQGKVR